MPVEPLPGFRVIRLAHVTAPYVAMLVSAS
jgi:hypothetical protein